MGLTTADVTTAGVLAGFGLALAVLGLLAAAVPSLVRRLLILGLYLSTDRFRLAGLAMALIGLGLVWLARDGAPM